MAPGNAAARAGLVRALALSGRPERAREVLAAAEAEASLAADPALAQARAALELAENRVDDSALQVLRAAAAEAPSDMDRQFAFAEAAFAAGARDEAAETLLHMVRHDRDWNEGAARARLLQMFEAVGMEDAWTVTTRRRLSRLLFG